MAGVRSGTKAAPLQCGQPARVAIWHARFDFEHKSSALVRLCFDKVEQYGQGGRGGINDYGAGWGIEIASAQDGCVCDEHQHGGAESTLLVDDSRVHGLSTQVRR